MKAVPQVQIFICIVFILINFSCTKKKTYEGKFLCFDLSIEKKIKKFDESKFVKTAYLQYFDDSQYGKLKHYILGKRCEFKGKEYDLDFNVYFFDGNLIAIKVFSNKNINLYKILISESYISIEKKSYFLFEKDNNDYKILLNKNSFNKCIIFPADIEISKLVKLQILE